jgi:hypothetical protein
MRGVTAACLAAGIALGGGTALAQRTWIVDQNGGPGAQFATIDAALAVAAPRDRILVRPGTYRGATTHKGVVILGENGATLDPSFGQITIENLPRDHVFVLAGFAAAGGEPLRVRCLGNAGRVHLQGLLGPGGPMLERNPGIEIVDCALVTMNHCRNSATPAVSIVRSHVLATDCELRGLNFWVGFAQGPALFAQDSTVSVVQPRFTGADDIRGPQATPGIATVGTELRVTGDGSAFVQGGASAQSGSVEAIRADGGSLWLDPTLALNPFAPSLQTIAGSAPRTVARLPAVSAPPTAPGGPLRADLFAPAGASALTVLSLPIAPRPSPFGWQWLDLPNVVVLGGGGIGPGEHLVVTMTVPAGVARGASATLQGIVDAGGGPRFSEPVVVSVQ